MGKVIVAIAGAIPAKLVFWVDDGVLENPTSSMNLQVKLPFCSGVSQPAVFSSGVRFTFDTIQRALSSLMLRPERHASHILRLYKHYEKHRKTNKKYVPPTKLDTNYLTAGWKITFVFEGFSGSRLSGGYCNVLFVLVIQWCLHSIFNFQQSIQFDNDDNASKYTSTK